MAEETPETPETEAPEAVEETAAPEAEATEAAPADEAAEAPAAEAEAPAPKAEPVPQLTPKERKAASRARRGQRRPSSPEERDAARKEKAKARSRRRLQEREKANAARTEIPAPTPPTEKHAGSTGKPKVRQGIVVSDKADKTITVRVDGAKRHRKYQKIVRSSTTLHAHDENNDAGAGDTVRVVECRPLSRTKRWRLVEILERAK